jgi:hypothetical protein
LQKCRGTSACRRSSFFSRFAAAICFVSQWRLLQCCSAGLVPFEISVIGFRRVFFGPRYCVASLMDRTPPAEVAKSLPVSMRGISAGFMGRTRHLKKFRFGS